MTNLFAETHWFAILRISQSGKHAPWSASQTSLERLFGPPMETVSLSPDPSPPTPHLHTHTRSSDVSTDARLTSSARSVYFPSFSPMGDFLQDALAHSPHPVASAPSQGRDPLNCSECSSLIWEDFLFYPLWSALLIWKLEPALSFQSDGEFTSDCPTQSTFGLVMTCMLRLLPALRHKTATVVRQGENSSCLAVVCYFEELSDEQSDSIDVLHTILCLPNQLAQLFVYFAPFFQCLCSSGVKVQERVLLFAFFSPRRATLLFARCDESCP